QTSSHVLPSDSTTSKGNASKNSLATTMSNFFAARAVCHFPCSTSRQRTAAAASGSACSRYAVAAFANAPVPPPNSATTHVFGAVAFLLVFVTLLGNKTLGPKRASAAKVTSYECGEKATPGARGPIDVQYYMYVLTFLIFDVEAMFLIPFALRFRKLEAGPIV